LKILILSDSHGHYDDQIGKYCHQANEIWHAGDIGGIECADRYNSTGIFKAVSGNIDDHKVRKCYPPYSIFSIENVKVLLIHIAFRGSKLNEQTKELVNKSNPDILVYGHSHIVKVWRPDEFPKLLAINPGAVGYHGFHHERTMVRININDKKIDNVELIKLGSRNKNN
jgi:uncharacterized protein